MTDDRGQMTGGGGQKIEFGLRRAQSCRSGKRKSIGQSARRNEKSEPQNIEYRTAKFRREEIECGSLKGKSESSKGG
jgi:hypothetical protein